MIIKYTVVFKLIPSVILLAIGFLLSDGLLVELAISWVLLLLVEKKGLGPLGLIPTKKTAIHLFVGFALAAIICAFNYYLQTVFSGSTWLINKSFTTPKFFSSSWWTMQSVLYEELIFRGALLYIAIKKIGAKWACILSAVCFGIYHWFSMNAFGNWVAMAFIFTGTAIMGYVFALAYAKTKSLYLQIGLHFGWNLVNTVVFSQGPIGDQLLILTKGEPFNIYENTIVIIAQFILLPLVALLYIKNLKSAIDKLI